MECMEHREHHREHKETCADETCANEAHAGKACAGETIAQATRAAGQAEGKTAGLTEIVIGMATCGIASGAEAVFRAFEEALKEKGLADARVTGTGCLGRCVKEPLVEVIRPGEPPVFYANVTPEKAREIVDRHIGKGEVVAELELR
ncbi:MAG: (2Fe-2S) ferredoxin domain-containing protein [Firmicutes bacterium]|nr:(2Fe-2S) ferredoxin domain-containing protein [Bacillota bacterium]